MISKCISVCKPPAPAGPGLADRQRRPGGHGRGGPPDRLGAGLPHLAQVHRGVIHVDPGDGHQRCHRVRQPGARRHPGPHRPGLLHRGDPGEAPAPLADPAGAGGGPGHPRPGRDRRHHGADRPQPVGGGPALPALDGADRDDIRAVEENQGRRPPPPHPGPGPDTGPGPPDGDGQRRGDRPGRDRDRQRPARRRRERQAQRPGPGDDLPGPRRRGLPADRPVDRPVVRPARGEGPGPGDPGGRHPDRGRAGPGPDRLRPVLHAPAGAAGRSAHARGVPGVGGDPERPLGPARTPLPRGPGNHTGEAKGRRALPHARLTRPSPAIRPWDSVT